MTNINKTNSVFNSATNLPSSTANLTTPQTNNTLCIQLCNLRSIVNKYDYVSNHLKINSNVDILFITETWLTPLVSDAAVCPDGFSIMRADRSSSKGGGVCIIYKSYLNINKINSNNSYGLSDHGIELLCVELSLVSSVKRFCCLYVPPSSSCINDVMINVCKSIRSLSVDGLALFILGDFNLPHICWDTLTVSAKGDDAHNTFLDFSLSECLQQCISEPTHKEGNVLDLLLCNPIAKHGLISTSVNPPISTTCDHLLISFTVKSSERSNTLTPKFSSFPDYKRGNYPAIIQSLSLVDWQSVIDHEKDLQSIFNKFLVILHSLIDKYIPKRTINKTKHPKIPIHIRRLLKQKLQIYKKTKSGESSKEEYKTKSQEYDVAVRQWNDHVEQQICLQPSSKKFYNFFKRKMKTKSSIPPLLKNGSWCYTDTGKANALNSFFHEVFTIDNGSSLHTQPKQVQQMEEFEITTLDVHKALIKLKDKITRTPEGVPPYFIKRIAPVILHFLTFFFNASLTTGFVPSQWKKALVVPVFKKGDQNQPNNYRPISLTSSFSRIMESILHQKILSHLLSKQLISPNQFGFLPEKSPCSQILSCLHEWITAYCENQTTHVFYADISKAFDSVSHSKLVSVIESYGLNISTVNWIAEFLRNRNQQVIVNDALSPPCEITSGVPQGSIIGPLLFIIYMNDIDSCAEHMNDGGVSLFADDTKFYSQEATELQTCLDNFDIWLKSRQLNLAVNKCHTFHVGKSHSNHPSFTINNTPISSSHVVKDLGIFLSDNLKWATHVNRIYRNAMFSSYHIVRFSRTHNIWVLLKLYKTYVRPKVEYSTPTWSPSLKGDIRKIEKIQEDFTRYACRRCNIPYKDYSDRLIKLNLQSLELRRKVNDLLFLFKTINGTTGLNFEEHFSIRPTTYNLRGNKMHIKTNFDSFNTHWCNSFFRRVVEYWNVLPIDVKSSRTVNQFKAGLLRTDLSAGLLFP